MNNKLEKFIKKNKPKGKVSQYNPYRQEIEILIEKGYSTSQIYSYMREEHEIILSLRSLQYFISKLKTNDEKKEKIFDQKSKKDLKEAFSKFTS